MYRGSNSNPEAVFREHTTANTGFELAVGNGSVTPVTVAEGVYNTTSAFRIPSGVNFNLLGLTAVNGVLYVSNASGQVAQTAQGASGTVLHGGGATAPGFGQVVGADMAAQTITYSKIQVGTTGKLYGTASGTTFAEVTLGTGLSFTGSTLNATTGASLSANNTWTGSNAFNGGIGAGSGNGFSIYNTANTFFSLLNPSGGFTANRNLYVPDETGTILAVGAKGQISLSSGTISIGVSGVTTSSKAFVTFVSIGGTVATTWQYKAVCTSGTVTITAITNTGSTNTSDTSTLNYFVTQ